MAKVEEGQVTSFDSQRGLASIQLSSGHTTTLHMAGMYGGRGVPAAGDRVVVELRQPTSERPVAITGRVAGR